MGTHRKEFANEDENKADELSALLSSFGVHSDEGVLKSEMIDEEAAKEGVRLHNIGYKSSLAGKLTVAEASYLEAIQLLKVGFGEIHPQIAICTGNIGVNYKRQGRVEKSIPYYLKSISIFHKCLSKNRRWYHDYYTRYNDVCGNLSFAYRSLGNPTKAAYILVNTIAMQLVHLDKYPLFHVKERMEFEGDQAQIVKLLNLYYNAKYNGYFAKMVKEYINESKPWSFKSKIIFSVCLIVFGICLTLLSFVYNINVSNSYSENLWITIVNGIFFCVIVLIVLVHNTKRARFLHVAEHKNVVQNEIKNRNSTCSCCKIPISCIKGKTYQRIKQLLSWFSIFYTFVTFSAYSFLPSLYNNSDSANELEWQILLYLENILLQFKWEYYLVLFFSSFVIYFLSFLVVFVFSGYEWSRKKQDLRMKHRQKEIHSLVYEQHIINSETEIDLIGKENLENDAGNVENNLSFALESQYGGIPQPYHDVFGLVFFSLFYLSFLRNGLLLFNCDLNTNKLIINDDIQCWNSLSHLILVLMAVILISIQIILGYHYTLKYKNKQFPTFTFIPGYNVLLLTIKLMACLISTLYSNFSEYFVISSMIVLCLCLLICSVVWQPYIGQKQYVNNANTAVLASSLITAVAALIGKSFDNVNLKLFDFLLPLNISYWIVIVCVPITLVLSIYLNNKRSIKYVIPNYAYTSLEWYQINSKYPLDRCMKVAKSNAANNFVLSKNFQKYAMYLLDINDVSGCDMFLLMAQATSHFAKESTSTKIEDILGEDEKQQDTRYWLSQLESDFGRFKEIGLRDLESAKNTYYQAFQLCPYNTKNISRLINVLTNFRARCEAHVRLVLLENDIKAEQEKENTSMPGTLGQILAKYPLPSYLDIDAN